MLGVGVRRALTVLAIALGAFGLKAGASATLLSEEPEGYRLALVIKHHLRSRSAVKRTS